MKYLSTALLILLLPLSVASATDPYITFSAGSGGQNDNIVIYGGTEGAYIYVTGSIDEYIVVSVKNDEYETIANELFWVDEGGDDVTVWAYLRNNGGVAEYIPDGIDSLEHPHCYFYGGDGDDIIVGGDQEDHLEGGHGDDWIFGAGSVDYIKTYVYSSGVSEYNNVFSGSGVDDVYVTLMGEDDIDQGGVADAIHGSSLHYTASNPTP